MVKQKGKGAVLKIGVAAHFVVGPDEIDSSENLLNAKIVMGDFIGIQAAKKLFPG